jgi:hypothetical protein
LRCIKNKKMKKIALLLAIILCANYAVSQKKFRFGLKLGTAFNWMKPDNEKKFENDGVTMGFNWGLQGEYALNNNISAYFGLEINHERGKINFTDTAYYFMREGYEFIPTTQRNEVYVPEKNDGYPLLLNSRIYKNTYVSIPVGIKMKTNEIGYMTYFGQFGLNLGFRTGTKITEDVNYLANTIAEGKLKDISNVNMDDDMQPIRVQLRVGGGAEYKISEGTSVFGVVHYNLGFTNVVKGDSKYLLNSNSIPVSQKFSAHGVSVSVGVLF